MEFLKNWILEICVVSFLIAVINSLAPKTSGAKLVRLCGSILLVFSIFAPLQKIRTIDFTKTALYAGAEEVSTTEITEENERLKAKIIEQHLTAYILKRTKQMGIDCEVKIDIGKDENGKSIPEKISITCNDDDWKTVRNMIQTECGITPVLREKESE